MAITLETIEKRIAELTQQREVTLGDLNAIDGALQDCQYWQTALAATDEVPALEVVE